ncbi:Asparagine synthetase [glutamine-hydrolyzing] 1 [bioreactor metagenome]|uniref:Asparagine synthetase [glutamine-hydrolyzing] 1 n=1 Tax=bioreactor metagenome TaxID=1076179 RepID=A0A644ZQD1_9ZZZZ
MCGICGFFDPSGNTIREAMLPVVGSMASRMVHRGPDEEGTWCDPEAGLALGHRRLSIIDLTPTGCQPMESFCGRYVIVFNGEIYNFMDIRRKLERESVPFRGRSDTEVVLAAVSVWGVRRTLESMVGMFAFALWDKRERRLTLARDRMGEKPLYYSLMGTTFLFASELKAMKAHPSWHWSIDRGALALFIRHNYIPAPWSIYEGVFKLPPATMLTVGAEELTRSATLPDPQEYWSLRSVMQEGIASPFAEDEEEVALRLEHLLLDSVKGQMMADVPLGAFLSGGIDSSTVVALMQSLSTRPVKTFTIGFREDKYNEAEHAKAVARHLGTDHTELYVTSEEAMSVISKLPSLYDEPFADSSQIPTYLVSQLARRHVTVSLSGDAGDELFAGYGRYMTANARWEKLQRLPALLRKGIGQLFSGVSVERWEAILNPILGERCGIKAQKLFEILADGTPERFYRVLVSQWNAPSTFVIGGNEPLTALTDESNALPGADFFRRMQYLDMLSYLPDDILVKVDRAAMGVSLESRVPFLDYRVVEFAARLPLAMKVEGNTGKRVLRKVLYKYVPKELLERPKMGFGVPVAEWLRGPLREWANDLLDPAKMKQESWLNSESVQGKWKAHLTGKADWSGLLWSILMFQAWQVDEYAKPPGVTIEVA